MINVLHLTSSFGLGGGAETNLARLVGNMESCCFRNTVVTMTDVPTRDYDLLRSRLGAAGVECIRSECEVECQILWGLRAYTVLFDRSDQTLSRPGCTMPICWGS